MSSSSLSAACSSSDMTVRLDDFDADRCLEFIAENDKWPKINRGANSEFGSDLQVLVRKLTTKIHKKYESTFFNSQDFPKIESLNGSKEFSEDQKILINVGKLFSLIFKTNQKSPCQKVQSVLLIDKIFFNFCLRSTLRSPTGRIYTVLFDILSKKNDHYKSISEAINNPSRRQDLRDDNVIEQQENFERVLKDILYPYIQAANALRKGLSEEFKATLDASSNFDRISSLIQQNFFNKDLFLMKFTRGDFDRSDKRFEWFLDKIKMLDFDKAEDQEIAKKINDFCSDGDLSKQIVLSASERTTGVHRGAFTLKGCYNADLNQAMLYLPAIFEKEDFFTAFDFQFLTK